jgi:hypothetical protein
MRMRGLVTLLNVRSEEYRPGRAAARPGPSPSAAGEGQPAPGGGDDELAVVVLDCALEAPTELPLVKARAHRHQLATRQLVARGSREPAVAAKVHADMDDEPPDRLGLPRIVAVAHRDGSDRDLRLALRRLLDIDLESVVGCVRHGHPFRRRFIGRY